MVLLRLTEIGSQARQVQQVSTKHELHLPYMCGMMLMLKELAFAASFESVKRAGAPKSNTEGSGARPRCTGKRCTNTPGANCGAEEHTLDGTRIRLRAGVSGHAE